MPLQLTALFLREVVVVSWATNVAKEWLERFGVQGPLPGSSFLSTEWEHNGVHTIQVLVCISGIWAMTKLNAMQFLMQFQVFKTGKAGSSETWIQNYTVCTDSNYMYIAGLLVQFLVLVFHFMSL